MLYSLPFDQQILPFLSLFFVPNQIHKTSKIIFNEIRNQPFKIYNLKKRNVKLNLDVGIQKLIKVILE